MNAGSYYFKTKVCVGQNATAPTQYGAAKKEQNSIYISRNRSHK